MAQLIYSVRMGLRPEVLAVLEDGVHPGRKVVSGPAWDSRPVNGFKIIQVPGVAVGVFSAMKAGDPRPPNTKRMVTRRRILNLSTPLLMALEDNGTVTVTRGQVVSTLNPDIK